MWATVAVSLCLSSCDIGVTSLMEIWMDLFSGGGGGGGLCLISWNGMVAMRML